MIVIEQRVRVARRIAIKGLKNVLWQIRAIARNLHLISYMTSSLNRARYTQTWLGSLWWLVDPLIKMLIYVFLFQVVLGGVRADYPVFLFAALVPWTWFASSINSSTTIIYGNMSLITQVKFPTITLIIANVLHNLFFFFFGILLLVPLALIFGLRIGLPILWLPLVILVQFFITTGFAFLFGGTGLFFRDLRGIVGGILPLAFYLSPGVYDVSQVPESLLTIYYLNPFSTLLPAYRDVLLYNTQPPLFGLFIWLAVGLVLNLFSLWVFSLQEPQFSRHI